MKRDMDLIRAMLLAIEADNHGFAPEMAIDGYTQEQIGYHAVLLGEAGLAKVHDVTHGGSHSPEALITRLTWEGHEFLDAARENNRWNKAKDTIGKIGGASLPIWTEILADLAKKAIGL